MRPIRLPSTASMVFCVVAVVASTVAGCAGPAPASTTPSAGAATQAPPSPSAAPPTFVIPPPPERAPFSGPGAAYGSLATVVAERARVYAFQGGVLAWPNFARDAVLPNDLGAGTVVLVSRGPLEQHAEWYEIYFTPIAGEPFTDLGYGWVRGDPSGDEPAPISIDPARCPDTVTAEVFAVMTVHGRLGCLTTTQLAVTGEVADCTPLPVGAGMTLWAFTDCLDLVGDGGTHMSVFIPPGVRVGKLDPGDVVGVVGHIDDPESEACRSVRAEEQPVVDDLQKMDCRAAFVVEAIELQP